MNQNQITEEAFTLLLANQNMRIIHGVLKSLHISPARSDYEDLLQEGCLLFVEAYKRFCQLHPSQKIQADFGKFAFRTIRWRLLDLLRHQQLYHPPCEPLVTIKQDFEHPTGIEVSDPNSLAFAADLTAAAFFQELWSICLAHEQRYLNSRLLGQKISDFAEQEHVSRQTVYNWRSDVHEKARRILD